jgi:hypothetical protein
VHVPFIRLWSAAAAASFAKDVESLVLRHQLVVLERHQRCPSLRPADRAFFAALRGSCRSHADAA